jgi:hypothetical protein
MFSLQFNFNYDIAAESKKLDKGKGAADKATGMLHALTVLILLYSIFVGFLLIFFLARIVDGITECSECGRRYEGAPSSSPPRRKRRWSA